jgi:hypothetical protein
MKDFCLPIACWLILAFSVTAAAQDYSGSWSGVVTESTSDCKNIVKAKPGEYQLTIVQKGDELTIMENVVRRPYRGFIEADNPRHVQVRGTYADAGGYVTEEVFIKFTEPGSGTGQSVWRWSDGWHQCGGRFLLTLKKNRLEERD